jgi:hypothetical protein
MFGTRKGLLLIILLFLLGAGGFGFDDIKGLFSSGPGLTEKAKIHILHGDERGGGHQFGAGKPCKSEFPNSWSSDEIIEEVTKIAANDNLQWKKQKNGYYVTEENVGGVRVRVVLNKSRKQVVTAYPVNVRRNPCPAPANDND